MQQPIFGQERTMVDVFKLGRYYCLTMRNIKLISDKIACSPRESETHDFTYQSDILPKSYTRLTHTS